jgi:F-type H+-transporting ATPase subunit a
MFIPSGVPVAIMPFLVLIEIISYFSRVISLSVRLFANMMSGHTLLKILLVFF